ncbi:DUF2510 domain-containing protein [Mycolicibacterium sp. HK-90]|uniref:DUF2510 domain-containing protein n=1 Tax=Mycolicibacterium sp. HK-90 TaxID=3056937 RepID=UPI0026588954|nr:DUF2510 domain-containing protein [Mycolicibacterium sp. HK-90]WKG00802.1 DUF2510 domain-containing protein [Mycolicibacterium sp. HK-90]
MNLKRTSAKAALAFGILFVIGVVARILGPLFGPDSYVGRDLVIFGPTLAGLGLVGVSVSLLVWAVKSSSNRQPTAPAGWYPDLHDATLLRYFDGEIWTQQTAPRLPGP